MTCSNCGMEFFGTKCGQCGLVVDAEPPPSLVQAGAQPTAEEIGRATAVAMLRAAKANQRFGFPAFLSLVLPGLGQLIKGQVVKGLIFMVGGLVACALAIAMLKVIGVFVALTFWVWNIYDAYTAQE